MAGGVSPAEATLSEQGVSSDLSDLCILLPYIDPPLSPFYLATVGREKHGGDKLMFFEEGATFEEKRRRRRDTETVDGSHTQG